MKHFISIAIVIALLLSVFPALAETIVSTGTSQGFGGEVTVTLTLTDGVITQASASGASETPGVGSVAVETFPSLMVEGNTINIDTITGATFSSEGLRKAAENALIAAGADPANYQAQIVKESAENEVIETDVVVIGAGGAGMTAAIVAANAGKSVVILESQAFAGGNSVKSTGGMNATETPFQNENAFAEEAGVEKTLSTAASNWTDDVAVTALASAVSEQWEAYKANPEGYFDSTELMALDTLIGGKGLNNHELVATLVNNSASAIEWLKTVDIHLTNVGAFGGASVKRIHRPVNDKGQTVSVGSYMIPRLQAACEAKDTITMKMNTTAKSLIVSEGTVTGVEAEGASGNKVTVKAKAVVLATGGFGANLDMVASYKPELQGFMTTNAPGILGEGILMAQAIGAATVDMDQIQIHPTVQADTSALITEGLRGDGAILVNSNGLRFIDEVGTRDVVSAAEIAQPGSFSWLIVDQKMVDASAVIQGYVSKGYTFSGETYEALADVLGVPADAFANTMTSWNSYVEAKQDPDHGRTSFASPLDTAPFYAIKVSAGIHHTMGGLKINSKTEVLKEDGTIIPGLFAAGEVTGGVHGANRLGGNAVADFVVFGRIAGENAAAYVK